MRYKRHTIDAQGCLYLDRKPCTLILIPFTIHFS
jgi:hypothetical protein